METNIAVVSTEASTRVPVNHGRLLEDNLLKFKGKYHHARGLAEYVSNSDDSYRRQGKFDGQEIVVELHTNRQNGRRLDKVVIRDFAEGMSFEGLENDFFLYFESHSGRREGKEVTGQFGTGGKAYAIMNFEKCWITSVKDGMECKAWFRWDEVRKEIHKGYDNGGYANRAVKKPNGTVIELFNSDNPLELEELRQRLNDIARIRHVIKNQNVSVVIVQGRKQPIVCRLEYNPPENFAREWKFELPAELRYRDTDDSQLILRYFEKPFSTPQSIDVQDGISSIVDMPINRFDERPFNKTITGEVVIQRLRDSSAVKENRKGLEEDDDLTIEIFDFLREKIRSVIGEIQDMHRQKEREKNIAVSSKKIRDLNKFLQKVELNFRDSINELKRRNKPGGSSDDGVLQADIITGYKRPGEEDLEEEYVQGTWSDVGVERNGDGPGPGPGPEPNPLPRPSIEVFDPGDGGVDVAVEEGLQANTTIERTKRKKGLVVMMTDDPDSPVSAHEYSEYEEPVSDRFLRSHGIILINVNNPIIEKSRSRKEYEHIFRERVANFVLLVVAQYQTERELEIQQDEDRDDPLQVFRRKFFELQSELRNDSEINYFDEEITTENKIDADEAVPEE